MASRERGEMQLLGVSREACKLSHMINSLPKVPHLHAQSAPVGDDLLKGALDLQDSLIALCRFQPMNELSQTKSASHTDREPIINEPGESSRRNSNRNADALLRKNCINGVSQRSCTEELKEAIKDSLCRQSILSVTSDDCEASFGGSSRFSTISRGNSFRVIEPGKGSNTSIGRAMKTTSPNLIAKLMGLEDIPAETIQLIKVENESERSLNPPRKIAHPMERKLTVLKQKSKPKWRTTQDVTERVQINACRDMSDTSLPDLCGKGSKVAEEGRRIMNSKAFHCTKRRKFQGLQLLSDKVSEQKVIRSAESVRATNVLSVEKEDILVGSAGKTLVNLSTNIKEDHTMVNLKAMPCFEGEESQEDCIDHAFLKQELEQSVELVPECISVNAERELQRERNRIVARRLEKTKVESSTMIRKSCNLCHKPEKKETVGSCKQQKSGVHEKISTRPNEHRVRPVQVSLMKTDKKMAVISDKTKAAAGSSCTVLRQAEGQAKQNATPQTNSTARNFRTPLIPNKIMIQPTKRSINMKLIKQKDSKTVGSSCKTDASVRNIFPSAQHPKLRKHRLESSGPGKLRKGQKMINEVMPKVSKFRNDSKLRTTAVQRKGSAASTPGTDFKGLLLNSGLFLVHDFELCIRSHGDVRNENNKLNEDGRNTELYLACAEELMARQSYHLALAKHPMLSSGSRKLSAHSSPDQLVEVINEGLIALTNYSKVPDDVTANHSLYIRLEKDLKCKDSMLNAMWDVGWWNGICLEEADLLAGQVEEDILSCIVLEVAMELGQSHRHCLCDSMITYRSC